MVFSRAPRAVRDERSGPAGPAVRCRHAQMSTGNTRRDDTGAGHGTLFLLGENNHPDFLASSSAINAALSTLGVGLSVIRGLSSTGCRNATGSPALLGLGLGLAALAATRGRRD